MNTELVDPKWYIVAVNNFEVTKNPKHILFVLPEMSRNLPRKLTPD